MPLATLFKDPTVTRQSTRPEERRSLVTEHQYTEGAGREPEHTHPAVTHAHDHWHISHHVDGGEVSHRTFWHSHEHNHSEITHSHDYRRADEARDHDKEAHIHDHAAPAESPA